eukprot:TRINITY_DN10094_c0_g3_i1.p1 TRINITY_DN10094_c0_g3~~TRINITY_DN10094_c0_g3_i1.p1  ORF type:complete len:306 (-),score=31.15 TRINITY_DN10094_c0_g3_i1:51-857(-)
MCASSDETRSTFFKLLNSILNAVLAHHPFTGPLPFGVTSVTQDEKSKFIKNSLPNPQDLTSRGYPPIPKTRKLQMDRAYSSFFIHNTVGFIDFLAVFFNTIRLPPDHFNRRLTWKNGKDDCLLPDQCGPWVEFTFKAFDKIFHGPDLKLITFKSQSPELKWIASYIGSTLHALLHAAGTNCLQAEQCGESCDGTHHHHQHTKENAIDHDHNQGHQPVGQVKSPDLCHNSGCSKFGSMRCGRCKEARYCDQSCQRQHWPVHKLSCVSQK